jgi:hypothetical protein
VARVEDPPWRTRGTLPPRLPSFSFFKPRQGRQTPGPADRRSDRSGGRAMGRSRWFRLILQRLLQIALTPSGGKSIMSYRSGYDRGRHVRQDNVEDRSG